MDYLHLLKYIKISHIGKGKNNQMQPSVNNNLLQYCGCDYYFYFTIHFLNIGTLYMISLLQKLCIT